MLMFLREKLGTFSLAGSAVGIYFVAMAVAAPIQGRLIDRLGPARLLIVTGVVHPLALLGDPGLRARGHALCRDRGGSRRSPARSPRRSPRSRARSGATASTTRTTGAPRSRSTR